MQLPRLSRRSLVLLLTLALMVVGTPARAAQPALPKSSPTDTHRCANGKTARAWITFGADSWPGPGVTRLAADNPCKGRPKVARS